jgi:hypothetical protein
MTVEIIRETLLWCTLINWGMLLFWFLFMKFAHDWVYRLHTSWFKISVDDFDAIHYKGMAYFKVLIFVFNLAPFLALLIVT